jgi:tellurite resistance protein
LLLGSKKQEFDAARAKLKTQFEKKEAEIKSNVEAWKANREVEKLAHRAERSEDYAATAIVVAMAAMDEVEQATLEAIAARPDAEAATGATKK